ncbi:uncharacterized protein LOC101899948 [Musca domestica]|uniref:Uncharacterized protein LOC101899948 n=1 Tax=Musca domestica TaxID=7370 RepID=A0A1I8MQL3_MUSDO|nr:uncharacterized protein LOC101899948 [Musca domestica]XP_058978625.1 uncharacterized protein LOC101899948 [Musca domestica]
MGSIDKACISGFLCRLCSEMHRIVIHIYGDQGQRLCLVEKINGYLPITISPTDPLPKTICTTCLRRVEQHYDLLMRLSRIREERFVELKKSRQHVEDLPYVSSPEYSEDDNYQSDNESRRQYQDPLADNGSPSTSSGSASVPLSSSSLVHDVGFSVNTVDDVTSNVDLLDTIVSPSLSDALYADNDSSLELTSPVHND